MTQLTAAQINSDPKLGRVLPVPGTDVARGCHRLGGRVAVVTAAARGIGFACALRLAAEGATVWITDLDVTTLEMAVTDAQSVGISLQYRVMDSLSQTDVQAAMAHIMQQAGHIDILVNNAGGSLGTPFLLMDESDADWRRVLDLNVMGAIWANRAVLPSMIERQHGRIIHFGSKAARFGSLMAGANYAAAKGALASISRQMAKEFSKHGITVNTICPGIVMTDRTMAQWTSRRSPEERAKVLREIPLGRHAHVDDLAATVAFFASDDAAFITGAALDVNGGEAMA